MTGAEAGFLLLTGKLGNPERNVLTTAQLRTLAQRVKNAAFPVSDRELECSDLITLGYSRDMAQRILSLLDDEELLSHYLNRGKRNRCEPLSRISDKYPAVLRSRLGWDAPGCLWAKGDLSILTMPAIALVGSRDLQDSNRKFAEEVGRQAALQGYALISGNARGADRTAQNACLEAGGRVISIVADELNKQPEQERILWLSEDGFDEPFSAQRALSRNRCIHALGSKTFVAQCSYQQGGTWDGSVRNLRFGWSELCCFNDGSPAMTLLEQMGAVLVEKNALHSLSSANAVHTLWD